MFICFGAINSRVINSIVISAASINSSIMGAVNGMQKTKDKIKAIQIFHNQLHCT